MKTPEEATTRHCKVNVWNPVFIPVELTFCQVLQIIDKNCNDELGTFSSCSMDSNPQ